MSKIIEINEANFVVEVLFSPVPVLLVAYSAKIAPVLTELAEELEGKAKVVKFDVTERPALTNAFHISSVPTILVYRHGWQIARFVGAVTKKRLLRAIEEAA